MGDTTYHKEVITLQNSIQISLKEYSRNNSQFMKKLLIATNNKGKVIELQELLKDTGIELVTPADINLNLEVEEEVLW